LKGSNFGAYSQHLIPIENWARQQKDAPSRSEAIRRLIEIALKVKVKGQHNGDK
jgi:hypothetical protein